MVTPTDLVVVECLFDLRTVSSLKQDHFVSIIFSALHTAASSPWKGGAQLTVLLTGHTASLKRLILKGEQILDAKSFFKPSYVQLSE